MKKGVSRFARIWIVILFSNLACQTVLGSPSPTPHPELVSLLTDFDGSEADIEANFGSLEGWIDEDPEALQWAALSQVEAESFPVRFAATYALAETAEAEQALEALQDLTLDESVSIRVLAAEGLIVRGEPAGIPVLIEALDERAPLIYSQPPFVAWEYAHRLLIEYTMEEFDLRQVNTFEQAAAAQADWQSWWEENGEDIVWDEEQFIFRRSTP